MPIPVSTAAVASGLCSYEIGEDQCGPATFQVSSELFINQANFQVPATYVGVPDLQSVTGGALGHFVLDEGVRVQFYEGSGSTVKVVSVPSTCHTTHGTPIRIRGNRATFYECANGPTTFDTPVLYLGHDLLTWREKGLSIQVSFHGHSATNQSLDLAIARSLFEVHPRRS